MVKETKKTPANAATGSILEQANIVHALSYIPYFIGPVLMFFLAKSDKKASMHHVKYSALIAIAAVVLFILLRGFFANLVNVLYIVGSGYLAWKAYSGEEVKLEILDSVEEKISETVSKK